MKFRKKGSQLQEMQVFSVAFENCEENVTSLRDNGCVTIDAWPHEKTKDLYGRFVTLFYVL